MGSILAGAVLIGIGLVMDSSIFYGDFTVMNLIFDGLGLFWLGKGVMGLVRREAA